MRKLDEFSAKAHRLAIQKRFPQIKSAVLYETAFPPRVKFAALEIEEGERTLFTFYSFEEAEALAEAMQEGLERKTERMLSFYAGERPTEDDLACKRDAMAMLENPEDVFILDDRRLSKGERHLQRLLARAGGDTRKAWLLLDEEGAYRDYEEG